MTYIVDACAIVAFYKDEKGADKIEKLLDEAVSGQSIIYMNIINLIEVYYLFLRTFGQDKANFFLEEIYKLPISIVETIDTMIFSETSRLKVQYAIPLGDSIGLATAIKLNGTFVTADHNDFEEIEKAEALPFFWFR